MSKDNTYSEHAVRIIPVEFISDEEITPASLETVSPDSPEKAKTVELLKTRKRHTFLKPLFSRLSFLFTALILLIAVVLAGTKLVGLKTFTVISGSMEPIFPVGSMIYVKPVNYKDLKIGDVISFVANSDKTVVTHRIVDIKIDESDPTVYRFKTKGDANSSPDANLVHYKNVLGTPIVTLPYLGYLSYNIQRPPGIYIVLVAGTLLLAWTFLPGTLEERRKTARKSTI